MKTSRESLAFVDIHCHILPGIDDGARTWDESVSMAKLAAANGTSTIVATPHQLGNFAKNSGERIRRVTSDLQRIITEQQIPLRVFPGADVRIEPQMVAQIASGDVLSLADRRRHVLLELPHELYFPLQPVLHDLRRAQMVGILSHPERNQGILTEPSLVGQLVKAGCLMQITASSLNGGFGQASQSLCEWMLSEGLVHMIASDGHGPKSRRPLMEAAYHKAAELAGETAAQQLCCANPRLVCEGGEVRSVAVVRRRKNFSWWAPTRRAS